MTAQDLLKRLKLRYAYPEWAFFEEVYRPTTRGHRFADGMALNLWRTRGMEFQGFEIKVDRGDLRRELKDPSKSEEIAEYVDRWWLVVPDKDLVKPGELPPGWGLITAQGDGLRVVTQAPKLDAKPLDRKFCTVLIKQFYDSEEKRKHTDEVLQAEYKRGFDAATQSAKYRIESSQGDLDRLKTMIATFEQASGVKITQWDTQRIGDAVRLVMQQGHLHQIERLRRFRGDVEGILKAVDTALAQGKESVQMT